MDKQKLDYLYKGFQSILLTVAISYASKFVSIVEDLNTKMVVIVERTNRHEQQFEKYDYRFEKQEDRLRLVETKVGRAQ